MFIIQIVSIAILFLIFTYLVIQLFKQFNRQWNNSLIFIIPLFIFTIGFVLRIIGTKSLVDLGFFFTDFSSLFIYTLFAICVYFGQLKYWKK